MKVLAVKLQVIPLPPTVGCIFFGALRKALVVIPGETLYTETLRTGVPTQPPAGRKSKGQEG